MNFLITGGAGTVGRDLYASLLAKGHRVRVLDKRPADPSLQHLQGSLEDPQLVARALDGIDTVVHLAWSFSDDPAELLEGDLRGHVVLLEACAAAKISRLFYTSTAVVYGKPTAQPITEDSPCLVADARKPFYAIAKQTAENLALAYGKTKGLPVTIFRFWWSYGNKIGGRHLRDMIALAQAGKGLAVPARAGGSFLDHDDLTHALLLAQAEQGSIGQVFNLATLYLEWTDVACMIIDAANSSSPLDVIPHAEWQGAQLLADPWELSTTKAERLFRYRSLFSPSMARQRLGKAIAMYREELNRAL
jgi:UDP-glucose 4-epimerase